MYAWPRRSLDCAYSETHEPVNVPRMTASARQDCSEKGEAGVEPSFVMIGCCAAVIRDRMTWAEMGQHSSYLIGHRLDEQSKTAWRSGKTTGLPWESTLAGTCRGSGRP